MSFPSGVRIGKYEIRQKLGQGGFGILYSAHDAELGRDIAIKFLRPEHAFRTQVVQRFLQEARAAARISHPGIVTVFESGQVNGTDTRADGTVYIAMELLAGDTLANRLHRGGRMPYGMAIGFCRQMATALAAAHQAGIVHRDLKPQNVFIVSDPSVVGGERIKILDFGIAKLVDDMGSAINTHSMLMLGTPMYMSPEQCKSSAKVDQRSDIYSLGCMLFEMVCGKPPFAGDSGELIAKHQLVTPPSVRSLVPELPPVLDQIITAMLAKNPDERPQTMSAVLDLLEECGDERAIEPPTVTDMAPVPSTLDETPRSRISKVIRGRTGLVAGAIGAIAIGIAVGTLSMCGGDERQKTAPVAVGNVAASKLEVKTESALNEADIERRKFGCLLARTEKRWADLAVCAKALAAVDAKTGAELAALAAKEAENERSLGRLETAVADNDLTAAKLAFDEIEEDSEYRRLAQANYDFATRTPTAPQAAAGTKECDAELLRDQGIAQVQRRQHKAALAKFYASLRCESDQYVVKLAFVAACNARNKEKARELYAALTKEQREETASFCEKNKIVLERDLPKCDADALKDKGMELITQGQHAAALAQFEASLRCKNDSYVIQLAFMESCSSGNSGKAKYYFKRMTVAQQNKFAQICIRTKTPYE